MGDLSGDGVADLVVAAPLSSTYGCSSGVVYIFYGPLYGEHETDEADAILYSTRPDDNAGVALSAGGEVNGDGFEDLLIGASSGETACDTGGGGYSYLLYGPIEGALDLALADVTFGASAPDIGLGEALSLLSDLDNDGHSDVVLGAPGAGSRQTEAAGAAYVFLWPLSAHHRTDEAAAVISGPEGGYSLGTGTAGGGDVNADGYDDLLIGAYQGRHAYLFLGGPRQ